MAGEKKSPESTGSASSITDKLFKLVDTATKKLLIVAGLLAAVVTLFTKWEDLSNKIFPVDKDEYVEIILDSSANMKDEFDQGKTKWQAAEYVVASAIPVLAQPNRKLALRQFGGDCDNLAGNSKLSVEFGKDNVPEISGQLQKTELEGGATLVNAIAEAIKDFQRQDRFETKDQINKIIVISGSGDVCKEALQMEIVKEDIARHGIVPKFRIIGMGANDSDLENLAKIASALGGEIVPVDNEKELSEAITRANSAEELTSNKAQEYYDGLQDGRAFPLFKKRAEDGDVDAMVYLANILADETSKLRDDEKAMFWYKKAAGEENPEAMYRLGEMYLAGRGAEKNVASAQEWFSRAAREGHEKAREKVAQLAANPGR